jgi:predicted negative regulator of RcsB-dependent stress response
MDLLRLTQQAIHKNMLPLMLILVLLMVALLGWKIRFSNESEEKEVDTTQLVAVRDKLNADIGKLLAASSVDQASIDKVTGELTATDAEVLALVTPVTLDFKAFDAAVAAFKADPTLTQAAIDVATGAITAATV